LPACLQCTAEFPAPPVRRGKAQVYCSPPCQMKAANMRRASTRAGRINGITYPHTEEPLQRLETPEAMSIPPSVDRSTSDRPSPAARLSELMDKAHSRVGVTAWEIAEIAKLRNISAWAPVSVISPDDRPTNTNPPA
jgi:hypothetical protein